MPLQKESEIRAKQPANHLKLARKLLITNKQSATCNRIMQISKIDDADVDDSDADDDGKDDDSNGKDDAAAA